MNYLNLETRLLHAPEFIGSDPKARATWLNVSIFSAILENHGRIIGAKSWGNRQWQQSCGVTEREVLHASKLLTWDGDDLLIWAYPIEQESEVMRRRDVARSNGVKGGRPPSKPTSEPTSVSAGKPTSEPTSESVKERKEKEGKEINTAQGAPSVVAVPVPESLNTPGFLAAWADWIAYRAERRLSAYKPKGLAAQYAKLAEWGSVAAADAIRESIRNQWQGIFEPKANGRSNPQHRPSEFADSF
jgi:hypothetical protein